MTRTLLIMSIFLFMSTNNSWADVEGTVEIIEHDEEAFVCVHGELSVQGDRSGAHNPGGNVSIFQGRDDLSIERNCWKLELDLTHTPEIEEFYIERIEPLVLRFMKRGCTLSDISIGGGENFQNGDKQSLILQHKDEGRNISISSSCGTIKVKIRQPAGTVIGAVVTENGKLIPVRWETE